MTTKENQIICRGILGPVYRKNDDEFQVLTNMLKNGVDPNETDSDGRTPLMRATVDGDLILFNELWKWKPNIKAVDEMGYTLLHLAARGGNPEIVNILLKIGFDPNAKDIYGFNTLLNPALGAHLENYVSIIKSLLKAGADPNVKNEEGETIEDKLRKLTNEHGKNLLKIWRDLIAV